MRKVLWKENKMLFFTSIAVGVILLIAIAGPLFMPNDPVAVNFANKLQPPSLRYPFGTDSFGRCIFSRVIKGAGTSLSVAFTVVAVGGSVGVILGLICGYSGGLVDNVVMRLADIMLAFPGIILAMAFIAAIGPGLKGVTIALIFVHWTSYARLVRSEVLTVKSSEYVEAARAMGHKSSGILFRYVLPNVLTPVVVMATMDIAGVILAAASLSFLGLGIQPPDPEWGSMINEGRQFIRTSPYITLFPGLAVMVTILAFNLFGDSLRDALDPRLREGQIE
jgi:peptide/nickel transport system permease protein